MGRLWGELESQGNGNSQESVRVTPATTPSDGDTEPEPSISDNQKREGLGQHPSPQTRDSNISCLEDILGSRGPRNCGTAQLMTGPVFNLCHERTLDISPKSRSQRLDSPDTRDRTKQE